MSKGLAAHADSPSVGGWRIAENQAVFAPLLTGGLAAYDPFDAADRTGAPVESPVGCTVFRTFQGWTALSEMHPVDGVLHVVPIPAAVGYRLVHGLAGELGLLGEPVPAPRRDAADELLARTRSSRSRSSNRATPCGGTATCTTSSVTPTNESRWGNVMYIGAAPQLPAQRRLPGDDARPLRPRRQPGRLPRRRLRGRLHRPRDGRRPERDRPRPVRAA